MTKNGGHIGLQQLVDAFYFVPRVTWEMLYGGQLPSVRYHVADSEAYWQSPALCPAEVEERKDVTARLHKALEQAGLSDINFPLSDAQPLGGARRWSPRNSMCVEVRPIYTAIGFDYTDLSNWSYRVRWYESGSTDETLVTSAVEAVDLAVLKLGQARDQGCLLTC